MKTIGFAGCSFTYGDGLEYYDGTNTLSRFSTLVGNYFNVNSINQSFRGGSHTKIISWWEEQLKQNNLDAFVFQFTRWARSDCDIIPNVSHIDLMFRHSAKLESWLKENNLTIDDYIEKTIIQDTENVLSFLQQYENRFPIYILVWPEDTIKIVKNYPWLQDRLIVLKYQDVNYDCISDLMDNPLKNRMGFLTHLKKTKKTMLFNTGELFDVMVENVMRPELTIATDYVNFKKPRQDFHPSKLCHQVIADNIIWRLEHDNIFQNPS